MIQRRAPRAWALLVLLATQLLTTTLIAAEVAPASQGGRSFRVYDMLLFHNKPDLTALGLLPASGTGHLFTSPDSPNEQVGARPDFPRDNVDPAAIRREISKFRGYPGIFYLDIELWPIYDVPDAQIDQNIGKLAQVADIVRETAPTLQFGFYGVMPENVYWPLVAGTPDQLRRWRESAGRAEVIARKVDVIMPSLYTFYDSPSDRAGWEKWARIVLTEARRYGKPVYPFLWPRFHNSNEKLGGHLVPGDYWRMELETVRRYADGVILWEGDPTIPWDENAGWWQQTKQFLATLKQP